MPVGVWFATGKEKGSLPQGTRPCFDCPYCKSISCKQRRSGCLINTHILTINTLNMYESALPCSIYFPPYFLVEWHVWCRALAPVPGKSLVNDSIWAWDMCTTVRFEHPHQCHVLYSSRSISYWLWQMTSLSMWRGIFLLSHGMCSWNTPLSNWGMTECHLSAKQAHSETQTLEKVMKLDLKLSQFSPSQLINTFLCQSWGKSTFPEKMSHVLHTRRQTWKKRNKWLTKCKSTEVGELI